MAHAMVKFAAEVRRLMAERGMSLRGLAKAASYDPSYLSKVLSGHKPSSPYLAARLARLGRARQARRPGDALPSDAR
jgi:transcriptional regulator with XRE-family HTH domain